MSNDYKEAYLVPPEWLNIPKAGKVVKAKPLPEGILAPIYRAYLDAVQAGDGQPQLGAVIWTRLCINLAKGKESIGYHGNGFAWWATMLDNAGFGAKKYDNGPRVCQIGYDQLVERGVIKGG